MVGGCMKRRRFGSAFGRVTMCSLAIVVLTMTGCSGSPPPAPKTSSEWAAVSELVVGEQVVVERGDAVRDDMIAAAVDGVLNVRGTIKGVSKPLRSFVTADAAGIAERYSGEAVAAADDAGFRPVTCRFLFLAGEREVTSSEFVPLVTDESGVGRFEGAIDVPSDAGVYRCCIQLADLTTSIDEANTTRTESRFIFCNLLVRVP